MKILMTVSSAIKELKSKITTSQKLQYLYNILLCLVYSGKAMIYALYSNKRLLSIFVFVPTIIFSTYVMIFSSNRWITTSEIISKGTGQRNEVVMGISIGGVVSTAHEDTMLLKDYILSYDMLEYLDKTISITKLYRNGVWDPFSRLFKGTSREKKLKYFRSMISVDLNEETGTLIIGTQAYHPKDSQKINYAILERSEWFLNEIYQKIAQDQHDFFKTQVKEASKRLKEAQTAVALFQANHGLIDPLKQIQESAALIAKLKGELAGYEYELNSMGQYLNKTSPQVSSIHYKIKALQEQIEKERGDVIAAQPESLNSTISEYQDLVIEAESALEIYKSWIATLENEKLNSIKKVKSLVVISAPFLPEDPEYPRRLHDSILFFIIAISLYGIIKLILTYIEEHK